MLIPSTKHQTPNTKQHTPNTNRQTPDTKHQTPNTRHQTPSTRHQTPNTKHQTPNTKHQTPNQGGGGCVVGGARSGSTLNPPYGLSHIIYGLRRGRLVSSHLEKCSDGVGAGTHPRLETCVLCMPSFHKIHSWADASWEVREAVQP